jgi:hypothetical protein
MPTTHHYTLNISSAYSLPFHTRHLDHTIIHMCKFI